MTAPGLDVREHRDALVEVLSEPLNGHVYDYGKVPGVDLPGVVPNIFVMLAISRRYVPTTRASGLATRSGWRVETRHVGRTVDEANWAAFRVAQALDGLVLTVDEIPSTPITVESDDAVRRDEDRFSGFARWTFAL